MQNFKKFCEYSEDPITVDPITMNILWVHDGEKGKC